MKKNLKKSLFVLLSVLCHFSISSQTVYLQENIQNWTNRTKYGNYTQLVSISNREDSVLLSNCIVANAASVSGVCSAGRVQMKEAEGVIQLPAVPANSTVEFGIAAGGADRTVKLQKLNVGVWEDVKVFNNISTEGANFSFDSDFDDATVVRLAFPSKVIYVHDIVVRSKTVLGEQPKPLITIVYDKSPILRAKFGSNVSDSITIKGENLSNVVDIQLIGKGSTRFALSKSQLNTNAGSVNERISITYTPSENSVDTIKLSVSCDGADTKELEFIGMVISSSGDGSAEKPFSVNDVKIINNTYSPSTKYWVTGYIVGVPTAGNASGNLTSVKIETPFTGKTAIAIADNPSEKDFSKMIPVQLPTGNFRDILNLEDNPDNLNKVVVVNGTLEAYFSQVPGVKNISSIIFTKTSLNDIDDSNIAMKRVGDELLIESDEINTIVVYDLAGSVICSKILNVGSNVVNLKSSSKGILVVKIGNRFSKIVI
ncbi:hypothetical protein MASR2M117_10200 [Paludibacter sp.]